MVKTSWEPQEYERWVNEWQDVWDHLGAKDHGWETPWLDESWRDGNPIFSAWSPHARRGVRILQHPGQEELRFWFDSFGEGGSSDHIDELVFVCGLEKETSVHVLPILDQWLKGSVTLTMDFDLDRLAA